MEMKTRRAEVTCFRPLNHKWVEAIFESRSLKLYNLLRDGFEEPSQEHLFNLPFNEKSQGDPETSQTLTCHMLPGI